jgi:hypothetical protein
LFQVGEGEGRTRIASGLVDECGEHDLHKLLLQKERRALVVEELFDLIEHEVLLHLQHAQRVVPDD